METHDSVESVPPVPAAASRSTGRRYVGVLAPSTARRVERLVQPFGFTIEACRPDTFLEYLDGPSNVCAVIDPTQLAPDHLVETVARLRGHPRPAIVYTPVSPQSAQDARWIADETGAAVVFQSPDEDRARVARALVSASPPSDAAIVLQHLAPALAKLPHVLRERIEEMFAAGADVESPDSLALRADISRRSLNRWLSRVGVTSARLLLVTPGVLRGLRLLQETTLPMRTIATVCGLRSTRRLRDCTIQLCGLAPVEVRMGDVPVETLIERVGDALVVDAPVPRSASASLPRGSRG